MDKSNNHSRYHSIDNFRLLINFIINKYPDKKPILEFNGTVKLHGTNAGIGYNGNDLWCQSKTNIINIKSDNAGFSFFVEKNRNYFIDIMKLIINQYNIDITKNNIILYGEWCGEGIQKNVGISNFPKMFFIFDVKIVNLEEQTQNYYINSEFKEIKSNKELNIYNINEFKKYNIKIDFNNLEDAQHILEKYVTEVENECPVTKALGQTGIGEGIIFKHYFEDGTRFIFKVKGEKHSVSKNREKIPIKVHDEKLTDFVENTVTENRFNQSLEYLYEINPELETYKKKYKMNDVSRIIEWMYNDIFREERDVILENNYEYKILYSEIARRVVKMFKNKINGINIFL